MKIAVKSCMFVLLAFVGVSSVRLEAMENPTQVMAGSKLPWTTKALIGGGTFAATYLYNLISHYRFLKSIENTLAASESEATAKGKNFRFATWRQASWWSDKYWPLAADLRLPDNKINPEAAKHVRKALKQDVKLGDRIYIYQGTIRIDPSQVTWAQVKKALEHEKQEYELLLEQVGQLTDATVHLVDLCKKRAASAIASPKYAPIGKLALGYVPTYFAHLKAEELEDFGNELMEYCGSKVMFHLPSINPLSWRLAPCFSQASRLYWTLFKHYIRLTTLKTIIDEVPRIKDLQADHSPKTILSNVRQMLQTMIGRQGRLPISLDAKVLQFKDLGNIQDQFQRLAEKHAHYPGLLGMIMSLQGKMNALPGQIEFSQKGPDNTALRALQELCGDIDRIIVNLKNPMQ